MGFFIVIILLLILLILTSLLNTFLYFALKIITKEKYTEQALILPSFVSIILWITSFGVIIKIVSSITKMNLFDTFIAALFNTHNMYQYWLKLSLPIIIVIIITIVIQSFILLILNIDYKKIYNKFKFYINKKSNKNNIINNSADILLTEEKYKLNFINSFATSLFIFSFLFFITILLFCTGILIANKVI
ncbi:MAG: hypothetical protein RR144_01125 [Clostridia bacterium]